MGSSDAASFLMFLLHIIGGACQVVGLGVFFSFSRSQGAQDEFSAIRNVLAISNMISLSYFIPSSFLLVIHVLHKVLWVRRRRSGIPSEIFRYSPPGEAGRKVSLAAFLLSSSLLDLAAQYSLIVGFSLLFASQVQMMRAILTIATPICLMILARRIMRPHKVIGTLLSGLGVLLVAFASIFTKKNGDDMLLRNVVGVLAVVLSHFIQLIQTVAEVKFLVHSERIKGKIMLSLLLRSFETIATASITAVSFVGLFALYVLSGSYATSPIDFFGDLEWKESYLWISLTLILLGGFILSFELILSVLLLLSNSSLVLSEIFRTFVVWVVLLALGVYRAEYGEQWSNWTWFQLFGFCILVLGVSIDQAILKLPMLYYGEEGTALISHLQVKSKESKKEGSE